MNITEDLMNEHQVILGVIAKTLDECDNIESGKELNKDFFLKVVDFIRNYADKFHHAKEEDILFASMLENMANMHCNPIPVMLHEHEEGRDYLKGMVDGLENSDTKKTVFCARGYCVLLQQHIYKEDNVLYPMAEQAISDTQKAQVNEQYKQVEERLNKELDIEQLINI
ncbi:MAG: hemerythrin domain-containing protein [Bacteroidales bacterium]